MKKITQSHKTYDLPVTNLLIDDVKTIIELLLKAHDRVTITAGNYELDDPTEIKNINEPDGYLKEIEFEGYKEGERKTVLSLGRFPSISFYNINDELKIKGLVKEIEDFLNTKKSLWRSFLDSKFFFIFLVSIFFIASCTIPKNFPYFRGAVTILFIIIFLLLFRFNNYTMINLFERKERHNFFMRNKDKIILEMIKLAVYFIIGFLIGKKI